MLEPRPSEGLQHGGRKPVETSGAYFGFLKTFLLSVELENSVAHGHLVWRRHVGATV